MNYVALLIVAAIPLFFQSPAAGQTEQTTTTVPAAIRLSAELTRKIDTKDAKVGDEVLARTTADATLADGSPLPKGTRLTGTVTEARAESSAAKSSHLAITFSRAIGQDGHEIPLHATLKSMSAQTPMAAPASIADGYSSTAGTGEAPTAGTRRSRGTATNSMDGVAGNTTGELGGAAGEIMPSARPTGGDDPRAQGASAAGDYVHDALRLHRYPVANMPGVVLSSQVTASISGALDAFGQNIRLESGTRMTMDASLVAR